MYKNIKFLITQFSHISMLNQILEISLILLHVQIHFLSTYRNIFYATHQISIIF